MAADQKAVIAVAKLRDRANIGGEHTGRVNRGGRQIAGENEGTWHRKQKHVSRFNTHGRLLTVDAEPAIALHDAEELDLSRWRKADRPWTSGREAARYDRLGIGHFEDVREGIDRHFRTIAQLIRIFKY